jgi:glycine dehydrogenase
MLGAEGLKQATEMAILNANYMKEVLKDHYKILYTGKNGRCAHEMILDCNEFKMGSGVEVADIAKRLMDYGFHAPTVAFPVVNTLMVEPTESESKAELDRFCEAMIQHPQRNHKPLKRAKFDKSNNLIKNAPHTCKAVVNDNWDKPYSRQQAAYPLKWVSVTTNSGQVLEGLIMPMATVIWFVPVHAF